MSVINKPVKPALWYAGYATALTVVSFSLTNSLYEILATLVLAPAFFILAIKSAESSGEVEV
ncbi:hypothetical protein L3N51_01892 [Metallosphaera sp. J1]|nr:hypothetical protein [Metallosphaera javensis (ex Hofmann et al. 2022)]MCG3109597.1 hypothetical protein [Metallosphaera javensis (ex Hofmann et al. 2022)]